MKIVTSANCIKYFKAIFAVHGIPKWLYNNNARYFVSNEFHNFTTKWEFTHITSSPRCPQSNGFIEHMVQTVKKTLQKAKQSKIGFTEPFDSLRTTLLDNHLLSPAEILYGRKIKTRIPMLLNTNNLKDNQI